MAALPPFGLGPAATEWALDPGPAIGVALSAGAYVWGIRRLSSRGRSWSRARTASFAAGLVVIVVATQSGLSAYDTSLFSVHVVQHVLLGMVAPFLLALSAPITLALQATDRTTQVNLLRVVRSAPARMLTHPVAAFLMFSLTLYGLYFTPLYELSLRNGWVHSLVHLHFLFAGSVFFWVVIGLDPVARRIPFGARLGLVLLTVPFHAFVGVALMQGSTPIAGDWYAAARDWGASPMADQRAGGAIMWGIGDVAGLAAGAVVLVQWMAHQDRADRRAQRREDRTAAAAAAGAGAGDS